MAKEVVKTMGRVSQDGQFHLVIHGSRESMQSDSVERSCLDQENMGGRESEKMRIFPKQIQTCDSYMCTHYDIS